MGILEFGTQTEGLTRVKGVDKLHKVEISGETEASLIGDEGSTGSTHVKRVQKQLGTGFIKP